jgi:hypothetical protein
VGVSKSDEDESAAQWDLPGHPQKEAMMHCTHKYGHETLWMAMIDVDEFFLLGRNGQLRICNSSRAKF